MSNELCLHSLYKDDELYHHGIMGMHWGVRRYQNPDGSYTDAGRKRYGIGSERKSAKQVKKFLNDNDQYIAYNEALIKRSGDKIQTALANKRMYERKGKAEKARKSEKEAEKMTKIYRTAIKDLKDAYDERKDILEYAKKYYNVTMRDVLRDTSTRSERIMRTLGLIGLHTVGFGVIPGTKYEKGTKYSVKNTKDGAEPVFTDKRLWSTY